jgi:hypothetical protein
MLLRVPRDAAATFSGTMRDSRLLQSALPGLTDVLNSHTWSLADGPVIEGASQGGTVVGVTSAHGGVATSLRTSTTRLHKCHISPNGS